MIVFNQYIEEKKLAVSDRSHVSILFVHNIQKAIFD